MKTNSVALQQSDYVDKMEDDYDIPFDYPLWPTEPDYYRYAERIEGIPYDGYDEDYTPTYHCCSCLKEVLPTTPYCNDCNEFFTDPPATAYDEMGLSKVTRQRTRAHKKPDRKEAAMIATRIRRQNRAAKTLTLG
jgi:hypothetical protein